MKKLLLFLCLLFPFVGKADVQLVFYNGSTNYTNISWYEWEYTIPNQHYDTGLNLNSVGVVMAPGYYFSTSTLGYGSTNPADGGLYEIKGAYFDGNPFDFTGSFSTYPGTPPIQIDIEEIIVPRFTNFTFCISNDLPVPGVATWTYNGTVEQTVTLQPGQENCWTTPAIETWPNAATFNETSGLKAQSGTTITPGGADGSPPTIDFNPPAGGTNGTSGTGGTTTSTGTTGGTGGGGTSGGAGSTGTNTYVPPPYVGETAPTNLVTFSTPSTTNGAASESTLSSGFQLLHKDLLNLETGQKLVQNSIDGGFYTTSNQLGQLVTYSYSNVLIDGQWLPKIYAAITNLSLSNSVAGANTNFLNLTNYALESTLEAITNLLADDGSNYLSYTNDTLSNDFTYNIQASDTNAGAAATAANTELGSDLTGLMSGESNTVVGFFNQTIPGGSEPNFSITIPFAGVTMDFNPVTRFPWFFLFVHALVTWITILAFVAGSIRMLYKVLLMYAAAQTGHVPNMTGSNKTNSGGNVLEA